MRLAHMRAARRRFAGKALNLKISDFKLRAVLMAGLWALGLSGCGSMGMEEIGDAAAGPRQISVFVVSTRKGESGASGSSRK